ncbi:class I SAM-dependent methyltransferase [bacterium]|nr:class I SAM-dependent methyltransferase [bacterium]
MMNTEKSKIRAGTDLSRQVEYWNGAARGKAFSHPLDETFLERQLPVEASILDYGCGWGRILNRLAALGYTRLSGADPSPSMLERARAEHPGPDYRLLEGARLPFADRGFDCVLLFAVLTCVPTDSGQRGLVAEAARVLRPGGIFYVSDYLLQNDSRNLERYERGQARFGVRGVFELPEGAVLRHHERPWLDGLFAGFEPLLWKEFPVVTMNGNPARAFQWAGRTPA